MTTTSIAESDISDAIDRIKPVLEESRQESEQERRLSGAVVNAMRDAGLLRLWVPKEYGGRDVDLPVFMKTVERLSQIDSAAGWVFSTGAAGALLTAFLPEETAKELYKNGPDTVFPGASAPNGRAVPVDGGFKVTGRWPLASGAQHGDWLGGMALIFDGEAPRMDAHGIPDFTSVLFPREACNIEDTWHSLGMRRT